MPTILTGYSCKALPNPSEMRLPIGKPEAQKWLTNNDMVVCNFLLKYKDKDSVQEKQHGGSRLSLNGSFYLPPWNCNGAVNNSMYSYTYLPDGQLL